MAAETTVARFNLRWKAAALALALLAVAGVAAYGVQQLSRPDVLPLRELRVIGEFEQVSALELKSIVETRAQGNFLTVDVDRIHAAITALPWVYFAWVDRIWPDVLQVRVVEQKPVAFWDQHGLLNKDGNVFVEVAETDLPLPVFKAPKGAEKQLLATMGELDETLKPYQMRIAELVIDERKSLRCMTEQGLEIVIGDESNVAHLGRFLNVYNNKLINEERKVGRVDLRYSNGFAVGWVKEKQSVLSLYTQRMVV